ncbi:MAG: hypothetical protein EA351_04885 [Gemmatimonadales bacterium]|nr:MAG: hypothetical protein EA351_04885 [Gemmatimonadales bacterium]
MSDWREDLKMLLTATEGGGQPKPEGPGRVRGFISQVVVPAFEELATELQEYGRDVEVEHSDRMGSIRVLKDGKEEFYYEVKVKAYRTTGFAFPVAPLRDPEGQTYRAEIHLRDRPLHQDVTNSTKEDLIRYFLHDYSRHLMWSL